MKPFLRPILLLLVCFFLFESLSAQIVSNNAFLKGNYVEVGIAHCGSYGSSINAPSGYHPRGQGNSSGNNQLGFVANPAKNNWATYVGDYFLPGAPEEGWGMTINNVNYNNNLICSSPIGVQGGFVSYEQNSSQVSVTWQGFVSGLTITKKTYIPMNSLFFVTEVTVQNTSSNVVNDIFYMRNVDPDHGVLTPGAGGSFVTTNTIVNQNPNSCNQALVSAVTLAGNHYLGLGSIDARARVAMGGFSNRSAKDLWNGTGFSTSGTRVQDIAISVAFNLGNLQPNESVKFAYAYILDAAQLTQALAATNINLNVDGVNVTTGNTSNICSGTPIPITLSNTGTFTNWTWAPATFLNTTTGTSVISTATSPITYIATGTGVCGSTSVEITLNPVIEPTPAAAGAINGLPIIALGQTGVTFSTPPVANATSYIWQLPPGAVITSSKPDSNVITFNAPATTWCGDVTVTPKNSCGTGAAASLGVCISNIATGGVPSPLCGGTNIFVPYSVPLGFFLSGNVFTAQLSDANGSFANPVNIGTVNTTSSGFINAIIPFSTPPGSGYRIRVVSSNPLSVGTDNGSNLTVNPGVTPSVQINANQTTICGSTVITFTATAVNGGSAPTYQWRKNGNNVGTNATTYTDNTFVNGDVITCVLTSNATCLTTNTATSNSITLTGTTGTPSVVITANKTNACAGESVTFSATAINGGTLPIYQWRKNGNNVGTNSSIYTDNSLQSTDVISCILTSNATCMTTNTATSNNLSVTINVNLIPAITITSNVSEVCAGVPTLITFTANTVNGGSSPQYQWRRNGININGANAAIYSTNIFSATDVFTCVLTSNASCVTTTTATSNAISIGIKPAVTPTIDITATQTIICNAPTLPTVTFNASITNGGTNPVYQWRKNGVVVGTNSATYTDNVYSNGTTITCKLTSNSNAECLTVDTAISNTITMVVAANVVPVINISGPTAACSGANVTYTATTLNAGTNPTFQWRKNGINVGTNSSTYTDNNLQVGDVINCVLTSNAACVVINDVVSNAITVTTINAAVTPGVTITASQTVLCTGTSAANIQFRANPVNGGNNPSFQWYKNGNLVATTTNLLYVATGVVANDRFNCVMTSNAVCTTTPIALSDTITIVGATSVTPTLTIATTNGATNICSGVAVTINAFANNGGVGANYTWFRNGNFINSGPQPSLTLSTIQNGDIITCQLQSSLACASPSLVTSNALTFTVLPTITPTINITATQTSICTGNTVVFTANITNGGTNPQYQWLRNSIPISGENNSTFTTNNLNNGDVITCILTNNTSPCVTSRNVTSNSITITVSSGITPSVVITNNAPNPVCSFALGTVTFTALPSNAGINPNYQWYKNGIAVGTNSSTYLTSSLFADDEIYCVVTVTSGSGCFLTNTAISNINKINILPDLLPSVNIVASQTVICSSTNPTITFTATAINGGTPQYIWKKNGSVLSTTSTNTFSTNNLLAGDIITCDLLSSLQCANPALVSSNSIQISSATSTTPSISIQLFEPPVTICAGSSLSFVAYPINAGTTSTLQWRRNGVVVASTTSRNYTYTNVQPGDNFSCTVISNLPCSPGTATSAAVSPAISPIVSPAVSITASQTNVCAGTTITFIAFPNNGGSATTYLWRKNGLPIIGVNTNVYSDNNFVMGDRITCTISINAPCRNSDTAISNAINLVVTGVIPTATITASSNTLCAGNQTATFTVTANNVGSTPTYQWKKNGNNVGTNAANYTDNALNNNDTIYCLVTSSNACVVTITTNKIIMQQVVVGTPTTNNPITISCGNTANLIATPSNVKNNIRWYTVGSGGVPVSYNKNFAVNPTANGTWYAEEYSYPQNSILATTALSGAVTLNTTSAGNHRSGVALTSSFIYQPTQSFVVRYNKLNLDSAKILSARTGFFADPSTNTIWQIGNSFSNGNSYTASAFNRLYKLDSNLISTTEYVQLSAFVDLGTGTQALMAPGEGYLITYNLSTSQFNHININTGQVTMLGTIPNVTFNQGFGGGYAFGWSEFDGQNYYVICADGNNIVKINTNDGIKTVVQTYSAIANIRTIVFDVVLGRMYYQHPVTSQFSSFNNNLGYLNATFNYTGSVCTSTRQAVNVTVNAVTPTISTSGTTTFCNGGSVVLTASAGLAYQWQRNGNNITGATNQTFVATQTGNYTVTVTNANGCVGVSAATIVTVNASVTPDINITANQTTICSGTPITFTATIVNGGTSPFYQWQKNGINVGTNSATYTDNGLLNGDVVRCILISNATCRTKNNDTSNAITLTVNTAIPSVSITASQNNICSGTTVTFTATAVNGGTLPTYQWRKNGNNVGTNSATYSDNTLVNGDIISCVLVSNANCAATTPVNSNNINMVVSNVITPSVNISASNTNICAGSAVTFTASALGGGTTPVFQWRRNGINVGSNSNTFTTSNLNNGDVITCLLTSSITCVTSSQVTSNAITITVNSVLNPSITISSNTSVICTGNSATYTATAVNGGTSPIYQWRKNGVVVGNNSAIYTDTSPTDGAQIVCLLTSNASCASSVNATSNTLLQTLVTAVTPTITISGTTELCNTSITTLTAVISGGGTNPTYQWFVNGVATGTNSPTLNRSFVSGDIVTCRLTSSANCVTSNNVLSNSLTITQKPLVSPTVTLQLSSTTFCVSGNLVLTVNTSNFGSSVLQYVWLNNGNIIGITAVPTFNYNVTVTGNFSCNVNVLSTNECLTGTSYTTTNQLVTVLPKPSISVASNIAVFCTGSTSATFTATVLNAGINPTYQWRKNGVAVGLNAATYTDNALQQNDSIWCILNPSGTCNIPDTSNKIYINFLTVTNPIVVSPVNVTCGDSVTLSATLAPSNSVRWYNSSTASVPLLIGNNVKTLTTTGTTYFAEAFVGATSKVVNSIGGTATAIRDHTSVTGDDRGGLVISNNFIYYTGDNNTGRFDKNNLNIAASLPQRDGFFSDLSNGNLWQLGNISTAGASMYGGSVNRLYRLNENLVVTGQVITLSQTINLTVGNSFVASGMGYVLLFSSGNVWHIDLNNGNVTTLNTALNFNFNASESWASYGWAENAGTQYNIVYVFNNSFLKINVVTGLVTTLQSFSNLGDMAAIAFDVVDDRIYFHFEGSTIYGTGDEMIGYTNANVSVVNMASANCVSARVPLTVNITAIAAPVISTSGSTTICEGSGVTLTSTPASNYQWQRNGVNIAGAVFASYFATQSGNYTVTVTNTAGCSNVSVPTTVTVNSLVTPTISITASQTTICSGTLITFTANITNGGTSPIYQWRKNGNNVGTNSATYTDNTLVNGDVITCILTSNAVCRNATNILSNAITLTVNSATPAVSISASQNNICSGTSVTFTATPVNGGISPIYQWRKNGNNVGTNSATYTDNTLVNGDVITCTLTSNANCATSNTANSNSVVMNVTTTVTPTIVINTANTAVCAGTSVTFTANITNGGTSPIYQWRKNGINVGANSSSYTDANLINGDVITCVLQSNATCVSTNNIISNAISMTVNAVVVPTISITATATTICAGNGVIFTANATNAGTGAVYQWRKNGNVVGSNSATYADNTLTNGSTITCTLITNNACANPTSVVSNTITITVLAIATPSISITGPSSVCAGSLATYTASITNGGSEPIYQWRINGVNVGANSSVFTTSSLANGNIVSCVLLSNRACLTTNTATSNSIGVSVSPIVTPTVSLSSSSTSICSGNSVTITATPVNGGTSRSYSWFINGVLVSTTTLNTYTTNALTANTQIQCRMNVTAGTCLAANQAFSNTINVLVTPAVTPTVTISTPSTTIIVGSTVIFTAIPTNTGTVTNYQWRVNGNNVGTNSNTYTTNTLVNNDVVTCSVTGNAPCSNPTTANSNAIMMTVISNYFVRGRLVTPGNHPIPGAKVKVNNTDSIITVANGIYSFNLPVAGNYTITPSKNNDIVKSSGVNVIDVLLTQRHISNQTPITSAYSLLAADVNNSASISIVDVLLMRRLILGIDTTFAGNRLWGFVDSSHVFPNPTNPFPATNTSITIDNLNANQDNKTFIGFKLGDVNMDLVPSVGVNRTNRTAKPLILYYDTIIANNTDVIVLKIKVNNFTNLLGTQFTLHFNEKLFTYAGIQNMTIPFYYNDKYANTKGDISFIWTDENASAKTLSNGSVLFNIILQKKDKIVSKEDIDITSSLTEALAVYENNNPADVIKGTGLIVDNKGSLYANESFEVAPNPTQGLVNVRVVAKSNKKAIVNVYAVNGKTVIQRNIELIEGVNDFKLNLHQNELLKQGTYMITITGLDTKEAKPIILIR